MSSHYLDFVTKAYGSLEQPDFSFVKTVVQKRPYEPVIRRVRDYAAVEELTDTDDDVCFSYLLKGRANLWKLDLSMIGPFGIFVRAGSQMAPNDFVVPNKSDLSGYEVKIIDLLSAGGIRLLSSRELEEPVPLTLFNTVSYTHLRAHETQ